MANSSPGTSSGAATLKSFGVWFGASLAVDAVLASLAMAYLLLLARMPHSAAAASSAALVVALLPAQAIAWWAQRARPNLRHVALRLAIAVFLAGVSLAGASAYAVSQAQIVSKPAALVFFELALPISCCGAIGLYIFGCKLATRRGGR